MSFIKTSVSAIGNLLTVIGLAGAFLLGLLGVVYLSLRGEEIKVPEIVGKDFSDGEKDLSQLGLKIKKRATRYSEEKPNTVLEQSPKAGETAKTGQLILVVVSQINPESSEAPATVEKDIPEDTNSTGGTEVKPTRTNKNANVKKPTQTTRDVSSNKPVKNSNANSSSGSSANTSKSNTASPSNTGKTGPTNAGNKSTTTPTSSPKPSPTKTPTSGDIRTRRIPN